MKKDLNSLLMWIPVFKPGPTMIGLTKKYFITALVSECMIFGTTELMMQPSITAAKSKRSRMSAFSW